eukprot:Colp12_sorted_trinity150504_noHs@34252
MFSASKLQNMVLSRKGIPLLGGGKANLLVGVVVDGVVAAEETVTKDPQRTSGRGDIHGGEARDAGTLDVEDVVDSVELVAHTVDVDGHGGHGGDLVAVNGVLATDSGLATDSVNDLLDLGGGADDEGGTSVSNSLARAADGGATNAHALDLELPVSTAGDGNPVDVTRVEAGVNITDNELTALASGLVLAEVEGEDGLGDGLLVNEGLEEGRDLVDGDGVEAHSGNTVELSKDEGDARLRNSLAKGLALGGDTSNGHIISGLETSEGTSAVLQGELGAILLVGAGLGAVVLLVGLAGNVEETAGLGGHPEVGAASVEEDGEGLGGVADGDVAEVLSVLEVSEGDNVVGGVEVLVHGGLVRGLTSLDQLVVDGGKLVELDADRLRGHNGHKEGQDEVLHSCDVDRLNEVPMYSALIPSSGIN